MAHARRGQGRKAVVPHLEWDSNKARRCHGNRRRATPHPPSRERPQGASLSLAPFLSMANGPVPPTHAEAGALPAKGGQIRVRKISCGFQKKRGKCAT